MVFNYETLHKSLDEVTKDCNITMCNYAHINTTVNYGLMREKGIPTFIKSFIITIDTSKHNITDILNNIKILLDISNVTYRIYESSIDKNDTIVSFILVPYFITKENINDRRVLNSIMGDYHLRNTNITYNFIRNRNGIFVTFESLTEFNELKKYLYKKDLFCKIVFWESKNKFLMVIKYKENDNSN